MNSVIVKDHEEWTKYYEQLEKSIQKGFERGNIKEVFRDTGDFVVADVWNCFFEPYETHIAPNGEKVIDNVRVRAIKELDMDKIENFLSPNAQNRFEKCRGILKNKMPDFEETALLILGFFYVALLS